LIETSHDIPYAKELDLYIDTGLLELRAFATALFIILHIHGIRGLQLIELGWREKPDFLEHPGESTSRVSTSGETKDTDSISGVIWLDTVSF
jgi:hypothetical protein